MGIGSIERKYIIDIYKDAINHMKIIDSRNAPKSISTTLNEIPIGQVFRGTIHSISSGRSTFGVFFKAAGPNNQDGKARLDCIVVQLSDYVYNTGYCNCWSTCSPVSGYEPLNVELVIK